MCPSWPTCPGNSYTTVNEARFFSLSRETPLVRYLDLPEPADSIRPEIKLRVLAVIASPADYPALDVEREWANLKEALSELELAGDGDGGSS